VELLKLVIHAPEAAFGAKERVLHHVWLGRDRREPTLISAPLFAVLPTAALPGGGAFRGGGRFVPCWYSS